MSGSLIVGFSAAAAPVGLELGAPPATTGGPPGGFAGLLDTLFPAGGAASPEVIAAAAAALSPATTAAGEPTPTLPAADPVEAAAAATTSDGVPEAAKPLLLDLVRTLTALDAALQSGQPVDPLLRQRLDETLEALAAYLELPATAAPPITSPAAPGLPHATPVPVPPSGVPGTEAAATLRAAPPPSMPGDAPEAPHPVIAALAAKLQSMGSALEAAEPELAGRLQAVADKLVAARIDPQQLAALGLDAEAPVPEGELAQALEQLLRPTPPAKPAAAPPPFTAATLVLPTEVAAPRAERPAPAPPRPEAPAPAAPERRAEPAPEGRAAERPPAAEPNPPARNGAAGAPPAPDAAGAEAKPVGGTTAVAAAAAAATTAARSVHAAYQAPQQQINVPQVAFEMVRQFQAGNSRFQIRLDPPELGRIDVRMDVDRDGTVMARMTVERSETLDLMQRDQRTLERALAQAGLDSARTSLEFSLRQQGSGREQREGGTPVFGDGGGRMAADTDDPAPPATTYHRGSASPGGLNLFV